MINQLELFDKEDWQVLLEAEQYFKYLQKPNEAFSDMPVCPFLKAELEKDNLFVEIWKPDEKVFMICSTVLPTLKRIQLYLFVWILNISNGRMWKERSIKSFYRTQLRIQA